MLCLKILDEKRSFYQQKTLEMHELNIVITDIIGNQEIPKSPENISSHDKKMYRKFNYKSFNQTHKYIVFRKKASDSANLNALSSYSSSKHFPFKGALENPQSTIIKENPIEKESEESLASEIYEKPSNNSTNAESNLPQPKTNKLFSMQEGFWNRVLTQDLRDSSEISSFLFEKKNMVSLKNFMRISKKGQPKNPKIYFNHKIYHEFNEDYKPKVLTSRQYFKSDEKTINSQTTKPECPPASRVLLDSMGYYPRTKLPSSKNDIFSQLLSEFQSHNDNFLEILRKEEFDKKEFAFGKSMIKSKNREFLGFKKRKFDICAPKQTFLNSLENKAFDKSNCMESQEAVSKLIKSRITKKLEAKLLKNQPLEQKEKNFLEKEGMASSKTKTLAEIIRKHRDFFNLEKYTKLREKQKELHTKNQLKMEEIKKRQLAKNQEKGIFEPDSPLAHADKTVYNEMIERKFKNMSFDVRNRFSEQSQRTIRVMNLIKAKVQEDLKNVDEELEILSPAVSPLKQKTQHRASSQRTK